VISVVVKSQDMISVAIGNTLLHPVQVNFTRDFINVYTGDVPAQYPFENLTDFPSDCPLGQYAYGLSSSSLKCRIDLFNDSYQIWSVIDNGTFQLEIKADCGNGQCVYGINDDGSLDCRACSGEAGGGTGYWKLSGDYIYPNDTVANNTWIRYGWFNVSDAFWVYDNGAGFNVNVTIEGNLDVTGNITGANLDVSHAEMDSASISGNLIVNTDADISQNLDIGQDMSINGSINSSKSKSYFYFDENGTLIVHLED